MSRLRYNRHKAIEHLRSQCRSLRRFIDSHGAFDLKVRREYDVFNALAHAIIYQQLSGKAAATIFGRFAALFPDDLPEAAKAGRFTMEELRGVGLSRNKALAIMDLSEKSTDGTLVAMRKMSGLRDAQVIDNLCQVRGIGPWTAQMLLIFNLGRPDVMPATDLGVQKGVQAIYRMRKLPAPDQVLSKTRHLAPYRSAASWYFWRAADTELLA